MADAMLQSQKDGVYRGWLDGAVQKKRPSPRPKERYTQMDSCMICRRDGTNFGVRVLFEVDPSRIG